MKNEHRALRSLVALLLGLGWASTLMAAQALQTDLDLLGLPWAQIGIGCLLSLWGGLTRSAERVLAVPDAGAPPFRLFPELGRDVFVSSSCGFVTFTIGAWQQWTVWQVGVALWAAGYLGTRFLSALADRVWGRLATGARP